MEEGSFPFEVTLNEFSLGIVTAFKVDRDRNPVQVAHTATQRLIDRRTNGANVTVNCFK